MEGSRRDRVADLHFQIGEHGLWRILHAGLQLLDGPAACVDDPSGQGGRTPAGEPVEHDDLGSGPGRLERGADARGAETDHHDVGLKIPCLRH